MEVLDSISLIPGLTGSLASLVMAILDFKDGHILRGFEDALGAIPLQKLFGKGAAKIWDEVLSGLGDAERARKLRHLTDLGTDLADVSKPFRPTEALQGMHLEDMLGEDLVRLDPAKHAHKAGDFINPRTGKSYDGMGGLLDWSKVNLDKFERSIANHLDKECDHIFVDMTGLNREAQERVTRYIEHLDPERYPRVKDIIVKR
jgi:hypothetical protein